MNYLTGVSAPPDEADRWWQELAEAIAEAVRQSDPLVALAGLHGIGVEVDRLVEGFVREARRRGHSWTEIAVATDEPRQNAWRRWHDIRGID